MTQKNDNMTEGAEEKLTQQKLSLEVQELNLKLESLQRPIYGKSSFWFSIIAAVAALGGVLGQGYLSAINSKVAKLEVENANKRLGEVQAQAKRVEEEKEVAKKQRDHAILGASKAEKRLIELQNKVPILQQEIKSYENRREAASALLFKFSMLIPNMEQLAKESKNPEELNALINELKKIVKKAQYELYGLRIEIFNYQNDSKGQPLNIKLFTAPAGLTFYLIPYSEWTVLNKKNNLLPLIDEVKKRYSLHKTPAELSVATGIYFITIIHNNQIVDSIPVILDRSNQQERSIYILED